jgi:site-specific DNA recombinase
VRFADRHPEYLLAGLVKCSRCKGSYVGASAFGKGHRYRYYVCSTRQRYGPTGCAGERVRADKLEDAVFNALAALYSNPRLLLDAAKQAQSVADDDANRVEGGLASLRAELRKAESAIERYMSAFENGTITEAMFGERVRELGQKVGDLPNRESELRFESSPTPERLPSTNEIEILREELRIAAKHAAVPARKALVKAFVHELTVETRERKF